MRISGIIASGLLLAATASGAASADYFLKIEGVARETPTGPLYLKVSSTGDLDGDGLPDEAMLRLACTGSTLDAAHYSVSGPRDAASGQASGKRTHKPMKIIKEWGPSTPMLSAVKPTYNVKEAKGARMAANDGWTEVTLANADGLCPAADEAAKKATKTRSNIQNN